MSRQKEDPQKIKLDKFIQSLPQEFCYYVKPYNQSGKYYGFRTIGGAKAFVEGELKGNGDIFMSNTRAQVA
jgi:hypothetical protein